MRPEGSHATDKNMDVAIYDLDKTLLRKATFTPFLLFAARRTAPWRLLLAPFWILMMLGYRLGLYDRTSLKRAGMKLMLGRLSPQRLSQIGEAFADWRVETSGWNHAVIDLLERDRATGRRLVVATAAFEFYAAYFAGRLGIDTVIATMWDGENIYGGNCYGQEKYRRVQKWADLPLSDLRFRFVSDSFADAPLLDAASEAVFVTSSKSKAREARMRGWDVISP